MILGIVIGLVMLWSFLLAMMFMIWGTIIGDRYERPIDRIIAVLMITFLMCCGIYGTSLIFHEAGAAEATAEGRAG